jgi:hypothetical protein
MLRENPCCETFSGERIKEKIADGRVLQLVEQMLHAGVMESAKGRNSSSFTQN